MKELLYIGKFHPWTDKNEDEVYEALETFDKVKICVMIERKLLKGQPRKMVDPLMKDKVTICNFKKLKNLLKVYKNNKYIMFER